MEPKVYVFNHRCVYELEHVFQQIRPIDEPGDPTLKQGVSSLLSLAFESIKGNRSFPAFPDDDLVELYSVWDDVKILMDNLLYDLRNHLSRYPGACTLVDSIQVSHGAIYLYIGSKPWHLQKSCSNEALRSISTHTHL